MKCLLSKYKVAAFFSVIVCLVCFCDAFAQKQEWTEELIIKYLDENKGKLDPVEGIYSVSRNAERGIGKLKFSQKKTDFARVAIIRNTTRSTPDFYEFVIDGMDSRKYSKTAEFTQIQNSSAYLCKRLSFDDGVTYTFAYDKESATMEGVSKGTVNSKTLYYVKVYPK